MQGARMAYRLHDVNAPPRMLKARQSAAPFVTGYLQQRFKRCPAIPQASCRPQLLPWHALRAQHQQQHAPLLPNRRQQQRPPIAIAAGAAAAAPSFGDESSFQRRSISPPPNPPPGVPTHLAHLPLLGPVVVSLAAYVQRVSGLWRRFLPMLSLFFFLSFINTILDSLKDTLVVTAAGGGAAVIPFLTVYAVLPSSLLFLVVYSWASQRMSRAALFNAIVVAFGAFFAAFALFMMPNADTLHLHGLAYALEQVLPAGLAGAVGMLRNWTFTLFFCASELWGDVCMGLLFWGLANDTTSLADAPLMYPIFGLGANLAQAAAGIVLKITTAARASNGGASSSGTFCREVQTTMAVVLGLAAVALGVHHYITISQPRPQHQADLPPRPGSKRGVGQGQAGRGAGALVVEEEAAEFEALVDEVESLLAHRVNSGAAASSRRSSSSNDGGGGGLDANGRIANRRSVGSGAAAANGGEEHALQQQQARQQQRANTRGHQNGHRGTLKQDEGSATAAPAAAMAAERAAGGAAAAEKAPPSLRESYAILASSLEIRCLAVMSLAQGLCTSLMEFAWKSHMRLLYPNPSDFTAFLGDVATWTGLVTIGLMLASPLLFERLGWRGVAGATPRILLFGGSVFFSACIAYQHFFGHAAAAAVASGGAAPAAGGWLLSLLVVGGALLFVFSKGAKFSLFKPAEEMVYITLDEDGRTRGKAAIDVVGSQTGKSGGSMLQQALLLLSAGAITGPILPTLFGCFFLMLRGWLGAVRELSSRRRYTLNSPMHTGEEEEPWPQPSAGSAVVVAPPQPLQPAEVAARVRDLEREER